MIQSCYLLYTVLCIHLKIISSFNYTLYDVTAFNLRERRVLYSMYVKEKRIFFMNGISNEAAIPIDVAVERHLDHAFELKLISYDIKYVYFSRQYLYPNIEDQNDGSQYDVSKSFLTWVNMLEWVENKLKISNKLQKIVIAKTYERRDIFLLKISDGPKKPIIFIVGGEEGKDWLSSAILLNFIDNFLKEKNGDTLLKYYDFYFVPVLNPDGFVYSKEHERFWTKNRRDFFPAIPCANESNAIGVNIARNWFFQKSQRFNDEECNGIYVGYEPLSEEETQTLSYVLNGLAVNMMAFVNLKGFGNYITIPYAYKEPSNNHDIIMDILKSATSTVKNTYNVTYYVDTTNRLIYNFSGNMADWVKKKLNVPVVFTIYMEDRNEFIPMADHITPLTEHFFTLVNDTVLIAKDIYGPLFNQKQQISPFQIFFYFCIFCVLQS